MEKLDCPFCGKGDALTIEKDVGEEGDVYAYHVECGHCGCHGRNNYPIGWCESEQEAVEAWNHRGSIRPELFFSANQAEKYSIEKHGPDGQYALYFGRDMNHHGARLCNLYDFDRNENATREAIVDALNNNAHLTTALT